MSAMEERIESFRSWVSDALGGLGESVAQPTPLEPVPADASSRAFYRVRTSRGSWIAIDSPPSIENNAQYVRLSRLYLDAGLNVPRVLAHDLESGFLLVSDLGTKLVHDIIDADNADALYASALRNLIRIQKLPAESESIPPYTRERLEMEVGLFSEWLVERFLGVTLSAAERASYADTARFLVDAVDTQPKVCVHRDFHSRNLLVGDDGEIGIVDFQDSLLGSYAYDPVSLLRDCYLSWPQDRIEGWTHQYHQKALESGICAPEAYSEFMRDFDLAGVQRHLKAVGIFARLLLRDRRATLIGYVPPVLRHVIRVSRTRPELAGLAELIDARILPVAEQRMESTPA
jgi:aminoglycoside/choline kinase family phosphotransferase